MSRTSRMSRRSRMFRLTTRRPSGVRTLTGTVLAAALLLPAATACSSGSSSSDAHGTATPTATSAAPAAPTTSAASGSASPTATPGASGATAPTATPSARHSATPTATGKATSPVRTQTLPDGSTVEIREVGPQQYTAKIVHGGQVLATLEAKDTDAGLDGNGMFVVLSLDGTVHAWMGGSHQGPGTFKLAGGWTAKVTKTGELRYRAEILGNDGAVNGTLEANERDAGAVANGVYIVLSAGGEISAHQ